jgi:hypothetical protein
MIADLNCEDKVRCHNGLWISAKAHFSQRPREVGHPAAETVEVRGYPLAEITASGAASFMVMRAGWNANLWATRFRKTI